MKSQGSIIAEPIINIPRNKIVKELDVLQVSIFINVGFHKNFAIQNSFLPNSRIIPTFMIRFLLLINYLEHVSKNFF